MEAAEHAFRAVTSRFPSMSGGHNNLGFILLARGDAASALDELMKARDLGYPQPEILAANVAAAKYLVGDFHAAREGFVDCFQSQIFRIPALLFGISQSGLFSTYVQSSAAYTALMALNVAWSSHAAGDSALAERYLAAAGALNTTTAAADETVLASLNELRAKYSEASRSRSENP